MTGPARAGVLIYAKDLTRLSSFYAELLQARPVHADADYAVLQSADLQLIVHAMPPHIADTVEIASPPAARDEAAYKPFFSVASLHWAQETVAGLGGRLEEQRWRGPGFTVCNAVDPEGNIFQLRAPA